MSLIQAFAADSFAATYLNMLSAGFYDSPDLLGGILPGIINGGWVTTPYYLANNTQPAWMKMDSFYPKPLADCPVVTFGARFQNINWADTGTIFFYLLVDGTVVAAVQRSSFGAIGPTTAFLEVEFDRNTGTYTTYVDGVKYTTIAVSNQAAVAALKTGVKWQVSVAAKGVAAVASVDQFMAFRDYYCVGYDNVYPNTRLGSITVSRAPIKVISVNGFNKSVADMETLLNQMLTKAPGAGGNFDKAAGYAQMNALEASIVFRLDTQVPVEKQVGGGIFMGERRDSSQQVLQTLKRVLGGVSTDDVTVDINSVLQGADRLHYLGAFSGKSASNDPAPKSVNDAEYTLRFTQPVLL